MDSTNAAVPNGWTPRLVLTTVFLSLVLEAVALGASMASIGLPSILTVFPTTQGGWIISIYFLTGAVAAPLLGKFADLYGKRRMLLVTLLISGTGALVCALAPSFWVLIVGRALQGVVLATLALTYSLIRDIYPPRQGAFAASITVTGMGFFSLGTPILIGWLLESFGFRGMFWFDVVWTFAMCAIIRLTTPESPLRRRARADVLGGGLLVGGVLALLVYVSSGRQLGWTSAWGLGLLVVAVVLIGLFVRHARRTEEPIVNLGLFTRRPLIFVTLLGAIGYALSATAGQVMVLLATTPPGAGGAYGLGFTTVQYAGIETPRALATVAVGVVLGIFMARGKAPRLFLAVGMAFWPIAMLLMAFRNDSYVQLLVAALVLGVATGLVNSSLPNCVINATPAGDQGSTAGAVQLCQTGFGAVAPILMFAVLAPFATVSASGGVVYSEQGFVVWLVGATIVAVAALLLGVTVLWTRGGPTVPDRFAERPDAGTAPPADRSAPPVAAAPAGEPEPTA